MGVGRLARLLAGDDDVLALARAALAGGAAFEIWPGEVPTARLVSIYSRRRRTAERRGQPSLGFDSALDALTAYDGASAVLGYVDDRSRGGFYFQLFLAPSQNRMIACLAIKPPSENEFRPNVSP
ncbi:hypothetical protein GCM10009555_035900 [Acrocarpospora macrocephala]|uniref:Uncharacterized protein n=1 Tax=Acrocarpospora macrocephala TaxID=150177 RepID=A0A5M3X6K5_9ACTN|nr:hypothetical protein Amac_073750 [Acrocarpospora macrocephala]